MENSKGNSTVTVIIAVILTALIVGGGTYYMLNNRVRNLEQQIQDLQASEKETPKSEEAVATEVTDKECYKTYTEGKVSFAYPCDWKTNVTGKNTMSAGGTVVAPDGKASFHYPTPDFGLHGMELTNEDSITINGNDYSTKTYEGNGTTLVFVEMGTALSEYEYNLMLAYESSEYKDELDRILETFEF